MSEAGRDRLIDLHAHILPGIDDGAGSLSESIEMARLAVDGGVSQVVATPHHYGWIDAGGDAAGPALRIAARVSDLKAALAGAGVELQVLPGAECRLDPSLLDALDRGEALPLGSSRYVLVEFPPLEVPVFAAQLLFQLQVKGYRPILAHPERNAAILEKPGLLVALSERGILAQVTSSSLGGAFGAQARRAAMAFLKQGHAQIIASDMHHADGWGLSLEAAAQRAARDIGDRAWAMVTSIPAMILADEPSESVSALARNLRSGQ